MYKHAENIIILDQNNNQNRERDRETERERERERERETKRQIHRQTDRQIETVMIWNRYIYIRDISKICTAKN
jgi:hypothetical protein